MRVSRRVVFCAPSKADPKIPWEADTDLEHQI